MEMNFLEFDEPGAGLWAGIRTRVGAVGCLACYKLLIFSSEGSGVWRGRGVDCGGGRG